MMVQLPELGVSHSSQRRPTRSDASMRMHPFGALVAWSLLGVDLLITLVRWANSSYQSLYRNPATGALDSVKFLDPALVVAFTALALFVAFVRKGLLLPSWLVRWLTALSLITATMVIGIGLHNPGLFYAAQSGLFLIRPFLLLAIFIILPVPEWTLTNMVRCAAVFGAASSLVTLYQWWQMREVVFIEADLLTGLFSHSHGQAMYSFAGVLLLLAFPRALPNLSVRAGLMILFISSGLVARNDKATLILLLIVAGGLLLANVRRKYLVRLLAWLAALAALGVTLLFLPGPIGDQARLFVFGNSSDLLRAYGLRNNLADVRVGRVLNDIGLVRMVTYFGEQALINPLIAIAGFGPGNFGSPASLAKLVDGFGENWQQRFFAWDINIAAQIADPRLQALSYNTSLIGVALGELGLLGFLPFVYLLVWPLLFNLPRARRPQFWRMLFWLRAVYLLLLGVSLIATSSSAAWENDLVMTILMCGIGHVYAVRYAPLTPRER